MDNRCRECGGSMARQPQGSVKALLALALALAGLAITVVFFPKGGPPGGLLMFVGAKLAKKTPRTWQCQTCGSVVAQPLVQH